MSYSILLIEDSKVIRKLISQLLQQADGMELKIKTASSLTESKELLHQEIFDCVLLDLTLPDSQAEDTFHSVHSLIPETSIIVTSGTSDSLLALDAVKNGAQDFLLKSELTPNLLLKTIQFSIERKKQLIEAEEKESTLRLQISDLVHTITQQNEILRSLNVVTGKVVNQLCQRKGLTVDKHNIGKVLLVDDCTINQKLTSFMFDKIGYDVDLANDGEEALESFKEKGYRFVFMDIQMPIMDGVTATKQIRKAQNSDTTVIIIALSATSCEKMKKTYLNSGFNEVLTKPINQRVLEEVLGRFIG